MVKSLNDKDSIKIANPRSSHFCISSSKRILEGERAIKFMRYEKDKSKGSVWLKIEYEAIENFKRILEKVSKDHQKNNGEYKKYDTCLTVSKYTPRDYNVEKGENCQCSVSKEKIEKEEYTLCLCETQKERPKSARVKLEYVDKLKKEILSWENIESCLDDEKIDRNDEYIDNKYCPECSSVRLREEKGGKPELTYNYLQCQNCGKCFSK